MSDELKKIGNAVDQVQERLTKLELWHQDVLKDNEPGIISGSTLPDDDTQLYDYEIVVRPELEPDDIARIQDNRDKYDLVRLGETKRIAACVVRVAPPLKAIVCAIALANRVHHSLAETQKAKRIFDWEVFAEKVSIAVGKRIRRGEVWLMVRLLLDLRVLTVKNSHLIVNEHLDVEALTR